MISPVCDTLPAVVCALADAWGVEYALGVSRRQAAQAVAAVRRWLEGLPLARLDQVGPAHVAAHLEGIRRLGRSAATVRNVAGAISVFGRWLVARGFVAYNPAAGVPTPAREQPCPVWLTEAEAQQALAVARQAGCWPEVALALATGLRIGELRRLRWLDVDAPGRVLLVRRAKGRRPRAVPVNALAAAALAEQRAISGAFSFVFPGRQTWPGGFRWVDKPRDPKCFDRQLAPVKAAVAKFGVRPGRAVGRGWHALRHSFGAAMAAAHVDTRTIQAWMGHADIRTTEIYTHLAGGYDPAIEAANFGQKSSNR